MAEGAGTEEDEEEEIERMEGTERDSWSDLKMY